MGSYTPNLNLYKPDPSDDYEDFLPEFNDNMNKLDNSGGGSGGHTIIDPLGQNMPQRTGLQFVGATVTDDSANDKTVVTITGGGGSGHNYSIVEQVIGTWIDGKPLYQITAELGAELTVNSGTWTNTPISNADKKAIINVVGINGTGTCWNMLSANCDTGAYVQAYHTRGSAITLKYLTIQYTKLTD